MYPDEYIQFLAHFHGDRDYFECHEVLEEYWKKTAPRKKDSIWVGLILMAVSTYHHRLNNFNGAKRTLEKAITIFENQNETLKQLGLDPQPLLQILSERLALITSEQTYKSFQLPISDPLLLEQCIAICNQLNIRWGQDSDFANVTIIQRHKLRDRTDVIQERIQSLNIRRRSNE
ncbi:putative metal-dependent hydrolase [Bacillus sp. SORGH_AS 510]|uniref:DUF309 domain-containing protein n=1 Tax=Bacillus sp. SORGH_AS_0510 TaxID=3041771 RepID=UPI002788DA16|nr:DUF309 domain-containing protein [Bacillus sp. SORGH_AS_0510]MDQ1145197.1 putative metal-dependent hydrolase [Bacillus sp. SORGH_AS_0510]